MSEAIISRRGGASVTALSPTITVTETTGGSISFTVANNDPSTAVLRYRIVGIDEGDIVELATTATSDEITIENLLPDTQHTLSVTANVLGKVKSEPAENVFTTVATAYMSAEGGITEEYDSGGSRYRSHTFLENGIFDVKELSTTSSRNQVDYLIVAGGGSGTRGNSTSFGRAFNASGGGGAGGFLTTVTPTSNDVASQPKFEVSLENYPVLVGAGGAVFNFGNGTQGNSSSVFGVPATGGGPGKRSSMNANGGSGGGGGPDSPAAGAGIVGQGFNGSPAADFQNAGGGGGGAGGTGGTEASPQGRSGGAGLPNNLRTGSDIFYAGGGAGGPSDVNITTTNGGNGGVGGGANSTKNAQTNTGGGGGGGTRNELSGAGNGGSGIVVIRYEIAPSV